MSEDDPSYFKPYRIDFDAQLVLYVFSFCHAGLPFFEEQLKKSLTVTTSGLA